MAIDPHPSDAVLDERTLVERARAGDADAFADLYRRHLDAVHALAYRRCGSRAVAEDVTAATFERALRGLGTFRWRGPGSVRAWLLGICARQSAEHFRQEARHRTPRALATIRSLHDDVVHDDLPPGVADDHTRVRAALAALHPRYERALVLRHVSGLSNDEAAAALGIARPTMAVVLHRARAAFRKALDRIDAGEQQETRHDTR